MSWLNSFIVIHVFSVDLTPGNIYNNERVEPRHYKVIYVIVFQSVKGSHGPIYVYFIFKICFNTFQDFVFLNVSNIESQVK